MANASLKKISKRMLVQGMYIQEFCGSWMEHPFWRSKFVLDNASDRERILQSSITELWIDVSKGLDVAADQADSLPDQSDGLAIVALAAHAEPEVVEKIADRPVVKVSLAQELTRAAQICSKSKVAVEQMFSEARMGRAVDAERCKAMVEDIASSVNRNPSALISLARLKTADEYTYLHSVAVCALMISLSRELGLEEMAVREAGLAGLLHDMGKALIPMSVLNKPGKLTEEEFDIIKTHPDKGHELLAEAGGASEAVLDACLHHHEKTNGSGYPHGLTDTQITQLAKMTAICDVYDAITSNRPYKRGWDPAESLRKMAEWSKGHFDPLIFQAFVKSLGIYPVGSLVRLQSNRLGVVVEQNAGSLLKPKVKVFFSLTNKMRITPQLFDLASTHAEEKIVAREPPENWKFQDLDELWQQA